MSLNNDVCRQMTTLDLTLMVMTEDANGVNKPVTPKHFIGLISGATLARVRPRLDRLIEVGVMEKTPETYRITSLGAGVLEREVADWEPSPRELVRREVEEAHAARTRA